MDKITLVEYIQSGMSQRQIAEKENKSQTCIRYHLEKYNLRTDYHKPRRKVYDSGLKDCPKCSTVKPLAEFYFSTEKGTTHWCKTCSKQSVLDRQKEFKIACLEYKNTLQCVKCGYNKFHGALEFHHRDRLDKDFAISKYKTYKLTDDVKRELDKCDVLCSNCHREEHHNLTKLDR